MGKLMRFGGIVILRTRVSTGAEVVFTGTSTASGPIQLDSWRCLPLSTDLALTEIVRSSSSQGVSRSSNRDSDVSDSAGKGMEGRTDDGGVRTSVDDCIVAAVVAVVLSDGDGETLREGLAGARSWSPTSRCTAGNGFKKPKEKTRRLIDENRSRDHIVDAPCYQDEKQHETPGQGAHAFA